MRKRQSFCKPCKDCEELFQPSGKYGKFCNRCLRKKYKEKYGLIKQEKDDSTSLETPKETTS
jgi:hypothetical protein